MDENELVGVTLVKKKVYSCQMLKIASRGGYVHAATENELSCHHERFVFGMELLQDIHFKNHMKYVKTKDIAKRWFIENLPKTKCIGIAVGPLSKIHFRPDLVRKWGKPQFFNGIRCLALCLRCCLHLQYR